MNILIISAHPSEKSFNNAIINSIIEGSLESGHSCIVRDLYNIDFNPVLTAKEISDSYSGDFAQDVIIEQQYIHEADLCVWVYPLWWGGMPAIMKGYIDRVFSYGFAYKTSESLSVGLLGNKRNIVINTIGASEIVYVRNGMLNAIETISNPGIFNFCGSSVEKFFHITDIYKISDAERRSILNLLAEYFSSL